MKLFAPRSFEQKGMNEGMRGITPATGIGSREWKMIPGFFRGCIIFVVGVEVVFWGCFSFLSLRNEWEDGSWLVGVCVKNRDSF